MTDDTSLPDALDRDAGRALVSLARDTAARAAALPDGEVPVDIPSEDHPALGATAGAFVTLEQHPDGRLLGCCGRPEPPDDAPLWRIVGTAAVDATRHDPRCPPVDAAQLADLSVTVSVLSAPTPIDPEEVGSYPDLVEVGRHGLIAERGRHAGLLLPQVALERDWSPAAFLTATCQKAGLPGEAWRRGAVDIRRFTARTFAERRPGGPVRERRFDGGLLEEDAGDSDTDPGTAPADESGSSGESASGESTADTDRTGGVDAEASVASPPVADGGRPTGTGVRPPSVAGQFYADSAAALRDQLAECFAHGIGPGPLEGGAGEGEEATAESVDGDERTHEPEAPTPPTALVSPHAGYPFSGPVAAHGYAAVHDADVDTVVVLGPNHGGRGDPAAVAQHEAWRTPLGTLPVDGDLAAVLVEDSALATFDDRTHAGEHSIEVQLPFLQYVEVDAPVLPVCLTRLDADRARQLGRDLACAIERTDTDALLVASTDLTHYEPHDRAVAADEPVAEAIAALDDEAVASARREGHSMCGPWATVATLTAARELGASEGELLQYATSGQTGGRRDDVVGYCSVALR